MINKNILNITPSLLLKVFFKKTLYTLAFISTTIFFIGCSFPKHKSPHNYSPQERIWLNKFFEDIMLRKNGIFTLWGSKPLTIIEIYHYSQEEVEAYYHSLSDEEKNSVIINPNYDLDETWEKWTSLENRFPTSRFLLFKKETSTDGKVSNIYLLDKIQLALTLQKHYTSFRNVVGFDFDAMKIIDELPSKTSAFWDKVLNHAALLGILLGFGAENSWAFHWKYCTQTDCLNAMGKDFSDTPQYLNVSTNNFPLPIFAIFTDEKTLKKYKTEQQNIRKIYKHNDFLDLTLKRLMM